MAKRDDLEHVGNIPVFRRKPKPKTSFGEVLVALIILFFGVAALSQCAG